MIKDNSTPANWPGKNSFLTTRSANLIIWLSIVIIYIASGLDLIVRITDLPFLRSFSALPVSMKLVTSICFLLTATSLAFMNSAKTGARNVILPLIPGIIVFMAGLVTTIFYLVIFISGPESSFLQKSGTGFLLNEQNRMSLLAAINFILMGGILSLLATRKAWSSDFAHIVVIPLAISSYMIPISYILGVQNLHIFLDMPTALNSGIAFCASCIAIFFMRPDTWLVKVFTDPLSGGIMARRLMPGVFLLPILIGWLSLLAERSGVLSSEIGVMLVALTYTVCFATFIWFVAKAVNRQDLKRIMYEKELAASESNLQAIFDATKESVYVFDNLGNILAANQTAVQRFELTVPEIIGRHFSEFMHEQLAKFRFEKMKMVFETGQPLQFEDERNGMIFLHNFYPVFEDDKVTRIVTYSRDITERHRMEEELKARELKFRNIFENSNDAIMITDIGSGKYIDCNRMAEIMTGYSKSEILSMKAGSLLKPSDTGEGKHYLEKLSRGESVRSETEIISKNGSIVPVEFNASFVIIDKQPHIVSLMRDISARKKAEEQLKTYASDLKKLVATKDKFFKIIAHDLKNPFSSLLAASEVLSRNGQNLSMDKILAYSEILNHSARNGIELLENLLEWSKTQTGEIDFAPETINLKSIVERNLLSFKVSALNKKISLVSEISDDFIVFGDKNMIDTIVRNLVSNAIKFTHEGGIITISAMTNENSAIITVKDTGIGIEQENIEKLFKIEDKYVNVGTANERGTGLGLLLCREFVENHQGKIWVESKIGKGSAFIVEIPLKKESSKMPSRSGKVKDLSS